MRNFKIILTAFAAVATVTASTAAFANSNSNSSPSFQSEMMRIARGGTGVKHAAMTAPQFNAGSTAANQYDLAAARKNCVKSGRSKVGRNRTCR